MSKLRWTLRSTDCEKADTHIDPPIPIFIRFPEQDAEFALLKFADSEDQVCDVGDL
jgi:hypothetical protein